MRRGYFLKRILMAIGILLVVIVLNFILPRLGPSDVDPLAPYYPPSATEENKQAMRDEFGYTGNMGKDLVTYLKQFVDFNKPVYQTDESGKEILDENQNRIQIGTRVAILEFSKSFKYGRGVMEVISEKLPWTLVLTITSLLINSILGITIGAYVGTKRGKTPEKILLGAASFTTAMPAFWIAMILLLVFAFNLRWFPEGNRLDDALFDWEWNWTYISSLLRHMILPLISMAIGGVVSYSMTTRNSMISVANEDYIMTAKAKGLSNSSVLYKHTLRNAMLPLVTTIGMGLSTLIGGAVVLEQIFSWNGMGTLFQEANGAKDFPLMQAIMLLMSTITLCANLLVDFLYAVLDPRIKDGKK